MRHAARPLRPLLLLLLLLLPMLRGYRCTGALHSDCRGLGAFGRHGTSSLRGTWRHSLLMLHAGARAWHHHLLQLLQAIAVMRMRGHRRRGLASSGLRSRR
jgi:hypothetical protein